MTYNLHNIPIHENLRALLNAANRAGKSAVQLAAMVMTKSKQATSVARFSSSGPNLAPFLAKSSWVFFQSTVYPGPPNLLRFSKMQRDLPSGNKKVTNFDRATKATTMTANPSKSSATANVVKSVIIKRSPTASRNIIFESSRKRETSTRIWRTWGLPREGATCRGISSGFDFLFDQKERKESFCCGKMLCFEKCNTMEYISYAAEGHRPTRSVVAKRTLFLETMICQLQIRNDNIGFHQREAKGRCERRTLSNTPACWLINRNRNHRAKSLNRLGSGVKIDDWIRIRFWISLRIRISEGTGACVWVLGIPFSSSSSRLREALQLSRLAGLWSGDGQYSHRQLRSTLPNPKRESSRTPRSNAPWTFGRAGPNQKGIAWPTPKALLIYEMISCCGSSSAVVIQDRNHSPSADRLGVSERASPSSYFHINSTASSSRSNNPLATITTTHFGATTALDEERIYDRNQLFPLEPLNASMNRIHGILAPRL
ncbi:unnamed protein product [Nesidiocoris tenuis]|uniref:Uncharacterized protein n=1 Tax=Nesidiocoris tenuis TaxID=355587 RepID=A0A6H5GNR2_9HEMI|nr:unnamed protein product [Nesidiocoris tenuis]